ncbi:hypothetical protein [Nonomuraea typhae]|uniref:Uncharacterized protein n=1 Tax=Nonomuraea typhae TaxID=2603600 RepID=A0ABW7YY94_9ACTN
MSTLSSAGKPEETAVRTWRNIPPPGDADLAGPRQQSDRGVGHPGRPSGQVGDLVVVELGLADATGPEAGAGAGQFGGPDDAQSG